MKWGGWPFVAFALTTVFGQFVSVYQYATATLLVLGGSTLAAIGVGFVYGRGKRVWCRHLCPVNGVFAALSRLAPVHFRVDTAAWSANAGRIPVHPVNCAPLVRIRRMTGPAECHMCGRCSDLRGAIALAPRAPNSEIAGLPARSRERLGRRADRVRDDRHSRSARSSGAPRRRLSRCTPTAAEFVVDHGPTWLLADNAPWWLLTNYPEAHDVFTWLDGLLIVAWIVGTAVVVGGWISACLAVAARTMPGAWRGNAFTLSHALIPIAAAGLFVGLTSLTTTLAHAEGLRLAWVPTLARATLLAGGGAWSLWLAHRQIRVRVSGVAQGLATAAFAAAVAGALAAWIPFVFRVF